MKRIYVASAVGLLEGRRERIDAAVAIGEDIARLGFAPLIPHLFDAWFTRFDYDYESCMRQCFAWVRACDAVYRVQNESKGADREVELARSLGMPVFTSMEELRAWL